ncbi:MAG: hypothetical protein RLZZ210_110 [Pseudomonadota bacterium]|jgi:OOP family OmpA-OmpF porin
MKKFTKLALAAMLLSAGAIAQADNVDNWRDTSTGLTWMNGTSEHCWKDAFWTKDTASSVKCGKPAPVVVEAPKVEPKAPVVEAPKPEPKPVPQISTEKFSFAADALFDFDKATLKDEGKAKLNELVANLKDPSMKLEVVVAVGHTDSFGSDKYNDKLSTSRADTVRGYLISQGLESTKVYAEGKGKRQLKVDSTTCPKKRAERIACEAANRRVEIEVSGVKTVTKMVMPAPVAAPAQVAPTPAK